jgi:Reverse transcriptase (RNA-dependent DNA polymerase)
LFKEKHDGTKKSRLVVRGYEQEPGVDYVESYSPLATNTTVKVVLAMALYYMGYFDDWVTDMVDVEAAFLNALLDTDVFIEMPEGLRELLLIQGVTLGDVIIKLLHVRAGTKSKTLDGTVLQDPCVYRA